MHHQVGADPYAIIDEHLGTEFPATTMSSRAAEIPCAEVVPDQRLKWPKQRGRQRGCGRSGLGRRDEAAEGQDVEE